MSKNLTTLGLLTSLALAACSSSGGGAQPGDGPPVTVGDAGVSVTVAPSAAQTSALQAIQQKVAPAKAMTAESLAAARAVPFAPTLPYDPMTATNLSMLQASHLKLADNELARAREERLRDLRQAILSGVRLRLRHDLRRRPARLRVGRFHHPRRAPLVRRHPQDRRDRAPRARAVGAAGGDAHAPRRQDRRLRRDDRRGRRRVPGRRRGAAAQRSPQAGRGRRRRRRGQARRRREDGDGRRRHRALRPAAPLRLLAVQAARALRRHAGPRAVLPRDDLARPHRAAAHLRRREHGQGTSSCAASWSWPWRCAALMDEPALRALEGRRRDDRALSSASPIRCRRPSSTRS